MEGKQIEQVSDLDLRYFVYDTFVRTSYPPTTEDVARHFNILIAKVESAFERLADTHHIALAPGSYSIWMAHPFSGIRTNYTAQVGGKKYWGN